MNKALNVDVCVIGGGAGGLSVAAGAVQMGATVALVEAKKMGGDCLNYGCVPSKALLAAAKTAHVMRQASQFGLPSANPAIDIATVMAQVKAVIAKIAVHDSVERFEQMGVTVVQAPGHFYDANSLIAGDIVIPARRFVIATGSVPAIPPIPGLEKVHFYTNETIFDLAENPSHLIVIGGGPIGCELAQAFVLLGINVTLVEAFGILPRDEPDLVEILRAQFIGQGLTLQEKIRVVEVRQTQGGITVIIEKNGEQHAIEGSHLLVATGRAPNVKNLHLEAAGIEYTPRGITVDAGLRTTNRRVYAVGDAAGSYQFTHVASYHAGIVLRNLLFWLPTKVDYRAVPWVTYTYPELAHAGLSVDEAKKKYADAKVFTVDFRENDRAQTEHETVGQIKVVTTRRGVVVGVTILGVHAGELLLPWIEVIRARKTLAGLASVVAPYPTLSEISKRVAGEYYKPLLFSPWTRRIVRLLGRFG